MSNYFEQGIDKLVSPKNVLVVEGANATVVNYLLWHPSAMDDHFVYASPLKMMVTPTEYMLRFGYPKADGVTDDVAAHKWQIENNPVYSAESKPAEPDVTKRVVLDFVYDSTNVCQYSGTREEVLKWLNEHLGADVTIRIGETGRIVTVVQYVSIRFGIVQ